MLTAIGDAPIGRERTGIPFPFITQRGMNDPQVIDAILAPAAWCEQRGIAFIHLAEADWDDAPAVPRRFRDALRATFSGTLIVAGITISRRRSAFADAGLAKPRGFLTRPFIANPDLPQRLLHRLAAGDRQRSWHAVWRRHGGGLYRLSLLYGHKR